MSKRRILLFMLTALMILCVLFAAACKTDEPKKPDGGDENGGGEKEPEWPLDPDGTVSDEIPVLDFEEKDFILLAPGPWSKSIIYERDEGQTADALTNAIYNVNRDLEDRFNIKYSVVEGFSTDQQARFMINDITAYNKSFTVSAVHTTQACASLIMADVLLPWDDVQYINLEKPWWNQKLTQTCSIMGNNFFVAGAYNWNSYRFMECIFFNKDLAAEYNIPDLYELVRTGKWTIDAFLDMTADISRDTNNDGSWDRSDFYAIAGDQIVSIVAFKNAFDLDSITLESENTYSFNVNTPKMLTALQKVNALYNENNRLCKFNLWPEVERDYLIHKFFMENHSVFMLGRVSEGEIIKDMDSLYGIIPYPKFNEAQEGYYTYTDPWGHVLAIPNYNDDLAMTGAIVEALQAEYSKKVVPEFYNNVMHNRIGQSIEDQEMLEIIANNITYDFGVVYDGDGKGFFGMLADLVNKNSTDIASYYAEKEPVATKHFDELFATIEDYYGAK